ncbi:hypothetical protein F4818DRAFT_445435 [Hypoxylon cercidicola]|nr:hypothetical protein F4818DRAFT_445435 [Hypoxylon cercidicola]
MHPGGYFFLVTALAGFLVLGNSKFSVDICPYYHLSEITDGSETTTHDLKFVATCLTSSDPPRYQESNLNFTDCINNNQAQLTDAQQEVPYPGPFSGSCIHCGIAATRPDGDGTSWSVSLRCQCANKDYPTDFKATDISLNDIIDVTNDGFLSCDGRDGNVVNGDPDPTTSPFPLDAALAPSSTTGSPISVTTIVETAPTTITETPSVSTSVCPPPVTITETHKKVKTKTKTETETETETETKTKTKKKTKTKTEKVTETALVNVRVTVFTATVYTTPPPSLIISASLQTTVKAVFTTMTVPAAVERAAPKPEVFVPAAAEPPAPTLEPVVAAPEPPVLPEGAI